MQANPTLTQAATSSAFLAITALFADSEKKRPRLHGLSRYCAGMEIGWHYLARCQARLPPLSFPVCAWVTSRSARTAAKARENTMVDEPKQYVYIY
jgi:hypothetical protein